MATRFWQILPGLLSAGGVICVTASPVAAEPYGTPIEEHFLDEANQYLMIPKPIDSVVLKLGYDACQARRSGLSSDEARLVLWDTWTELGMRPTSLAELGSIVHVAVENLCSEVGYP